MELKHLLTFRVAGQTQPKMRHILYAEGNPLMRQTVEQYLAVRGYSVASVADGQELMDRLTTEADDFDVILTSLHIPVMSGVEVLQKVRAHPLFRRVPVIVMTGDSRPEVQAAIEANDGVYFPKNNLEMDVDSLWHALKLAEIWP